MRFKIPGTLDYYLSSPYFRPQVLSNVPIRGMSPRIKHLVEGGDLVHPEHHALEFYCLNHLVARVRGHFTPYEQLPPYADAVMARYMDVVTEQTRRLLYYTLLIITREARHGTMSSPNGPMAAFGQVLHSLAEGSAVGRLTAGKVPDVSLHEYVGGLGEWFVTANEFGGSFGGKRWKGICDAVDRFITGKCSAEAFVDTGYTLEHNGGSMFNKGMLYHQRSGFLGTILDVQSSGQVPELVSAQKDVIPAEYKQTYLESLTAEVRSELGGVKTYVDWVAVEKSGKGKYPIHVQLQQKAGHGLAFGTTVDVGGTLVTLAKGESLSGQEYVYAPGKSVPILKREHKKPGLVSPNFGSFSTTPSSFEAFTSLAAAANVATTQVTGTFNVLVDAIQAATESVTLTQQTSFTNTNTNVYTTTQTIEAP